MFLFYVQSTRSPWWQEEDGKNKPRWRAECPTNGGVRKVGVFSERVISNGTETIDMYGDNLHCNFYFSAGKCLHIQCRRGAWCYLLCGNTVIVLKLLLSSCSCLSSFMMPVWEFLHVGARLTDAAAIYVTLLCYIQAGIVVVITEYLIITVLI